MTDKLRDALHQYEQIGPAKMDRSDLNIIRDAAALAQRSTRRLVELSEPGWIGAFAARDAAEALLAECEALIDDALFDSHFDDVHARVLLAKLKARRPARPLTEKGVTMTDEIELKRIDASLEDVLGDLEKFETRSDAVAEVCRMSSRVSALEALLAECETVLSGSYPSPRSIDALLAKLKARTEEKRG